MAKTDRIFYCTSCGAQTGKWMGRCPNCQSWGTIAEEVTGTQAKEVKRAYNRDNEPLTLPQIATNTHKGFASGNTEFDRVLGGGFVPGSVVLLGGEPGIGKSTLLLQTSCKITGKALYITGEESLQQVKLRAERLGLKNDQTMFLSSSSVEEAVYWMESEIPTLTIIDSIQTMASSAIEAPSGGLSQIRESAARLGTAARKTNSALCLVGHVTKDGMLAGPKVLEHMVDTVLQFEGDRHMNYRLLRTLKNRFGSTNELGLFYMDEQGLHAVDNPGEELMGNTAGVISGAVVAAICEGNRSFLVEIQALVSHAAYGTPQRTASGFDQKRLNLILAVLEKRTGYRFGQQDVFLKVAGGIKVEDPGADLAVAMALISSYEDRPVAQHACFAAEVGLGGELRPVLRHDLRLAEANRMGYKHFVTCLNGAQPASKQNLSIKIEAKSKIFDIITFLKNK